MSERNAKARCKPVLVSEDYARGYQFAASIVRMVEQRWNIVGAIFATPGEALAAFAQGMVVENADRSADSFSERSKKKS